MLATKRSDKNDPNDALSVAIAALRSQGLRSVETAEHSEIMRLLSKRNHDLGRMRARLICRLHHAVADLSPGGIAKELYVSDADRLLESLSQRPRSSTALRARPRARSMTYAALINKSRSLTDASARLSGHRGPRSPSSLGSAPSSPAR